MNEATCEVDTFKHIIRWLSLPEFGHTWPSHQTFMNISTVWPLLIGTTDCVIMTFPIISEHSSILVPVVWVETNFHSTSKVGGTWWWIGVLQRPILHTLVLTYQWDFATKWIRQRHFYQLSSVPPESSTLRMHVLMSTSIPLCKAVAKEKGIAIVYCKLGTCIPLLSFC